MTTTLQFDRKRGFAISILKRVVLALLLTCIAHYAWALDFNPFEGPKPIAVVLETNPWLMITDAETPDIVIYEDGQVVYLKIEEDKRPVYYHKQLTPQELDTVKKKLLSFGDLGKVKKHYVLEQEDDLTETKIYINDDGHKAVTSIYGLIRYENDFELPKPIRGIYKYLSSIEYKDAEQWTPQYVEVMLWSYENARGESIKWPDDFPGLESPNTLKRNNGYSIFLPSSELQKLLDFLATQKSNGAIEMGGKKWGADARHTFPSEPVWFKAFEINEREPQKKSSKEPEKKSK